MRPILQVLRCYFSSVEYLEQLIQTCPLIREKQDCVEYIQNIVQVSSAAAEVSSIGLPGSPALGQHITPILTQYFFFRISIKKSSSTEYPRPTSSNSLARCMSSEVITSTHCRIAKSSTLPTARGSRPSPYLFRGQDWPLCSSIIGIEA